MILRNALLVDSPDPVDIRIDAGRITQVAAAGSQRAAGIETETDLNGALVFPGLINSHDHLDFNLFPRLGTGPYRNYTEWGHQLQTHYRPQIDRVLRIPLLLREQWGILKNLLGGVTTVVNHGLPVKLQQTPIEVHERYHCLHSVGFEKHWRRKLNDPFRKKYPYVIHVGEGTDRAAHREIDRLLRWNLLRKPLVGVHAVAMDGRQAGAFDAIVWCPGSNFFMLNRTAAIDRLKETATILFGTDSTLTASWNIWDHLRQARRTGLLTDEELFGSLTEHPARIWRTGAGKIKPGAPANLVAASVPEGLNRMDAFFGIRPQDIQLVIAGGLCRLADESIRMATAPDGFTRVTIAGSHKQVQGNWPALFAETARYLPDVVFPFSIS